MDKQYIDKHEAYMLIKHEAETHELPASKEAYERAAQIVDQMRPKCFDLKEGGMNDVDYEPFIQMLHKDYPRLFSQLANFVKTVIEAVEKAVEQYRAQGYTDEEILQILTKPDEGEEK